MYYFIVNPASGSGKGLFVWKKIKAELERLGVSYRSYLLSGPGEAKKLAQGFSSMKNPATIVAVGGDGTINEIVNGLPAFHNITFACIPTGSGNDFVRGLELCTDPLEALHRILHPSEIKGIDIGCVSVRSASSKSAAKTPGGFSFAISSGIGYDAAVCDSVLRSRLKTLLNRFHSGKLIYLLTALWLLLTMKRQTFQVAVDDSETHTYEKAYFAAAMNLRYEGGGFMFCPEALSDDAHLDLIIANDISRLRTLALLPRALFGKHVGQKGIHILQCKKAEITVPKDTCLHTDGEIPGFFRQVVFSLREEKLPVIIR